MQCRIILHEIWNTCAPVKKKKKLYFIFGLVGLNLPLINPKLYIKKTTQSGSLVVYDLNFLFNGEIYFFSQEFTMEIYTQIPDDWDRIELAGVNQRVSMYGKAYLSSLIIYKICSDHLNTHLVITTYCVLVSQRELWIMLIGLYQSAVCCVMLDRNVH